MKYPSEIIAQHATDSIAVIDDLRAGGWIIVRHDAIRLAQAHAAADAKYVADNDNSLLPK